MTLSRPLRIPWRVSTIIIRRSRFHNQSTKISNDLFQFTSKRWLYNEEAEQASRAIYFDVDAAKRVACRTMGAQTCVSFSKLAEGTFNRVFTLRFDNDTECLLRMPYSHVGNSYLMTASEVATLDFCRTLGIPVPRVFGWSSKREPNPIGHDYILLEKMPGMDFEQRFTTAFQLKDYIQAVREVAGIERKLLDIPFSQIGSLFFVDDVTPQLRNRPLLRRNHPDVPSEALEKYRIGPIMMYMWWKGERASMDVDRGPWPDAASYITAAAKLEQKRISCITDPTDMTYRNPLSSCSRKLHLDTLEKLIQVAPWIVPGDDELTCPAFRHPDLNGGNIFVNREGPMSLESLIDWQGATTAPYYTQITLAPGLCYFGSRITLPTTFAVPQRPSNFDTLGEEEQLQVLKELREAHRHMAYIAILLQKDSRRDKVYRIHHERILNEVVYQALDCWADSHIKLRYALLTIMREWENIVSVDGQPCPISFSETEISEIEIEHQRRAIYDSTIAELCREIGVADEGDGAVPVNQFDEKQVKHLEVKVDELRYHYGGLKNRIVEGAFKWPFVDGGFSSWLC